MSNKVPCNNCNEEFILDDSGNNFECRWMTRKDGEHVFWFCSKSCKTDYRKENDWKWADDDPSKWIRNLYKSDNVEYVFACNYENFNDEFKEKYDRDASEDDWKLFKEKFNELRTSYICQNFHDGISEIIDQYYVEGFVCEGCKETKEPDGLEVSCNQCSKNHGCSECNGSWTVRERHFCSDCNTGYGCEMFCCDECGAEAEEDDDTTYAMDGTFCNEGCLQNYIDLLREEKNPNKE